MIKRLMKQIQRRSSVEIGPLIYEDELQILENRNHLKILSKKVEQIRSIDGKKMKMYKIVIPKSELENFKLAMAGDYLQTEFINSKGIAIYRARKR